MAYTIGIKRRFFPGYRKVRVTGHDWQNWRFILNLEDGSQEHIPGFAAPALKVYADFWTHLQMTKTAAPRDVSREIALAHLAGRAGAQAGPVPVVTTAPIETPAPVPSEPEAETVRDESPAMQEARRRAAERIRELQ